MIKQKRLLSLPDYDPKKEVENYDYKHTQIASRNCRKIGLFCEAEADAEAVFSLSTLSANNLLKLFGCNPKQQVI